MTQHAIITQVRLFSTTRESFGLVVKENQLMIGMNL